jgi:hypothetical protein
MTTSKDLKAQFQTIQVTRDDKQSIPAVRRSQIPVFSVFFGETDITYMDAGDYDGVNYSVPLATHVNKECMNYTDPSRGDPRFHVIGQVTNIEFEDLATPARIRMDEALFGDAVYFPDEQLPSGEYLPFLVLRHCGHGQHKFALCIGAGGSYGRLKRVALGDKALKIGKITATVTRV